MPSGPACCSACSMTDMGAAGVGGRGCKRGEEELGGLVEVRGQEGWDSAMWPG